MAAIVDASRMRKEIRSEFKRIRANASRYQGL